MKKNTHLHLQNLGARNSDSPENVRRASFIKLISAGVNEDAVLSSGQQTIVTRRIDDAWESLSQTDDSMASKIAMEIAGFLNGCR